MGPTSQQVVTGRKSPATNRTVDSKKDKEHLDDEQVLGETKTVSHLRAQSDLGPSWRRQARLNPAEVDPLRRRTLRAVFRERH